MAGELYVLDKQDIGILKELVRKVRNGQLNVPNQYQPEEDSPAPEVYVAHVQLPDTEISAMTEPASVPTPSSKTCEIYKLVINAGTGTPELKTVGSFTRVVYNVGKKVAKDWFMVQRDKYGTWYTRGYL